MRIYSQEEYLDKEPNSSNLLWTLNMSGDTERSLLSTYEGRPTTTLVDAMNAINNQGIESLNLCKGTYVIKGSEVGLVHLATSERIFLFAQIAKETGTPIYYYKALMQLSPRVLRIFLGLYKDCDNIAVVAESWGDRLYFERGLEEAYA